ncbi:type II secretion system minor pseudopilin GspK [Photobacterium galatheae]|uniref:Type II secretion system protein K n=1 Tax=Photobacterium galatheae TaxID=1654360 RepID=A0A066RPC0_9GAMM|nr:type II secretion system minor pseudopilin GspK [Photobacterium galatheae]KDM92164.1 general secretion pathway protein GspK [Photobacterium galatheae]MCM0151011.1 type II secretion system minor pseudopilin GspK [Photobacterium galatheae]
MRPSPAKQRGVALIVVLLLLAMMTLLAVQMTDRLQLNFYRVENQVFNQQAYWYSQGMEQLAKVAIEQSLSDSDTVNLSQVWATEGQSYPLDNGEVKGNIYDRQACFNLNALSGQAPEQDRTKKPFRVRFLQALLEESGSESYEAEVAADSVWEYVDPDETVYSAYGAGDSSYEGFSPPYLPPRNLMADITEFRSVNGVSAKMFQQTRALLCALPTTDLLINVNTITAKQAALLVGAFSPELSLDDARQLIENRPYDGWQDVDAFLADGAISRLTKTVRDQAKPYLAVKSDFFELDAEVKVDRARLRILALLKRDGENKVTVVRRRYGGMSERVSDDKAK